MNFFLKKKFFILGYFIVFVFSLKYFIINPVLWDDLPLFIACKNEYSVDLIKIAFDAGLPVYHLMNWVAFNCLSNQYLLGLGNLVSILFSSVLFAKYLFNLRIVNTKSSFFYAIIIASATNFYSVYFIRNAWFYHWSIPITLYTMLYLEHSKFKFWKSIFIVGINIFALTIASSYFFYVSFIFASVITKIINKRTYKRDIKKYLLFSNNKCRTPHTNL
jgi:hypothetical protein